jgi:hypothetical protein
MTTRGGSVINGAPAPTRRRRKTTEEKARQIVNTVLDLNLPMNEWYLIPMDRRAMDANRSISKAFGLPPRSFFSVMVACGFLRVRAGKLVNNTENGIAIMKTQYDNSFLHLSNYRRTKSSTRQYVICRAADRKMVPDPTPRYMEGDCHLSIKQNRKFVDVSLLNEVVQAYDATLPRSCYEIDEAHRPTSITISVATDTEAILPAVISPTNAASAGTSLRSFSRVPRPITPSNGDSPRNVGVTDEVEEEAISSTFALSSSRAPHLITPINGNSEQNFDAIQEELEESGGKTYSWPHEQSIEVVENLAFEARNDKGNRPPRREGGDPVYMKTTKQATGSMRQSIVIQAIFWGWESVEDKKMKERIIRAACKVVCYDCGLAEPVLGTNFKAWYEKCLNASTGKTSWDGWAENEKLGPRKGTYYEQIERNHPTFLHKMYRAAIKELGPEASWNEIAHAMNKASAEAHSEDTGAPNLAMNTMHVRRWFKAQGGTARQRAGGRGGTA